MNLNSESHGRPVSDGERGQLVPLMPVLLVAFLCVAAFVIDLGDLYYSHQQLVAATDAAALAGAYDLPNIATTTVTADATKYSAATGGFNARPNLTNVSITVGYKCLTSTGVPCLVPPGGVQAINAIFVTEHATVNTPFAKILGINSWNISSTATASAKNGSAGPQNVMILLDTTASMSTADTNCTVPGIANPTREDCALAGVRTLEAQLDPCAITLTTCGTITNGNVANPVAQVGLMVFPGLTPTQTTTLSNPPVAAATASNDYTCPGSNPSITSYNKNPGYLILPLQSDYRTSDTAGLNTAAHVVIATGGNGCSKGISDPGGEGTFYAGAIASAQAYLVANTRPNVPNVLILLSDGDATATSTQMAGSATSYTSTNECHQAITAAQNARTAGILVYAIAYGSQSSGCASDSPAITPCATMEAIASIPTTTYFFSDTNQSGSGVDKTCVNNSRPTADLNQVFTSIAGDFTVARLVPNNAL
jgi:hypothetical protein